MGRRLDGDVHIRRRDYNIYLFFSQEDGDPCRYTKWADGFMVVYSITSRLSFHKAREYLEIITNYLKSNSRDSPVALVGNKIDLERYR